MAIDKEKLKALAKASEEWSEEIGEREWYAEGTFKKPFFSPCDAKFISSTSPTTVLALLAEIERLDRESQNLSNQLGNCDRERRAFRDERDQLRAENLRLRTDIESWRLTVEAERRIKRVTTDELEHLKGPGFAAELAALRKDADRYRWLRDEEYLHNWAQVHVCDEPRRAEITDAAIDAAMGKEASHD